MADRAKPSGPPSPSSARRRTLRIAAVAGVLAIGSLVTALVLTTNSDKTPEPLPSFPAATSLGVPAAAAGCGQIQRPAYQGRHGLKPGDSHPAYSSDPPTSGWFMPGGLPGTYRVAQPIERVMNIPAHGGVAIFTTEADDLNVRKFYNVSHSDELVTLLYPELRSGVVFVAWGVTQRCERFSGEAALRFIDQYGSSKALKRVEPTASPVRF